MYREWKKTEFPKKYEFGNNTAERQTEIQMARWSKEEWETGWWNWVEGKNTQQRGMEEAPENGKESSHSAHSNEWLNNTKCTPNDYILNWMVTCSNIWYLNVNILYVLHLVIIFTLVLLMPEPCTRMGWKNTVSPFSILSDTTGWSSNPSTWWNALLTVCWNISTQVIADQL